MPAIALRMEKTIIPLTSPPHNRAAIAPRGLGSACLPMERSGRSPGFSPGRVVRRSCCCELVQGCEEPGKNSRKGGAIFSGMSSPQAAPVISLPVGAPAPSSSKNVGTPMTVNPVPDNRSFHSS